MIVRNAQHKRIMKDAARSIGRPFDFETLFHATELERNTTGRIYKERPSRATVKSLLYRAPWARPYDEHEYIDDHGTTRTRIRYVYDETWGEERKAMRTGSVSA